MKANLNLVMKKSSAKLISVIGVGLFIFLIGLNKLFAEITIKQWGIFEKELISTNSYSNAQRYKDVTLSGTFHGPDGVSYIVPGFWDGGNTWRIRFSPTIPGQWSYMINSSDSQLNSLENDGDFTCVAPGTADITKNANYRGFLKISSNKRYLTYADGTPFFWIGGTIWNGNCSIMPFENDFKAYVNNRKHKKFSVIQILVAAPGGPEQHFGNRFTGNNENGWVFNKEYDEINPANFQNFDLRIRYIIENGIVPVIFFSWSHAYKHISNNNTKWWYKYLWFFVRSHAFKSMSDNDMKNYIKYIVARYQAYNVIWCIAGEYYLLPDQIPRMRMIGDYVDKLDSLGHIKTIHAYGITRKRDPKHPFLKDSWNEILKVGTWDSPIEYADNIYEDYFTNNPTKPIQVSETRYEGNEPDENYKVYKYAWEALTAGAFGYTYGDMGICLWKDGLSRLDLPGSFQMKYMVEFFSDKKWWKLIPNKDLVDKGRCLTEQGKQYVVCLNGGGNVKVNLSEASGTILVKWFNPVTGLTINGGTVEGGTACSFTPPFDGDAVLYITVGEDSFKD